MKSRDTGDQLALFTDQSSDLAPPPQDSGAEEATIIDRELVYDPHSPKSFRLTIVEDLTNPAPAPGADPPQVTRAIRVRQLIPDPRTPKKLTTIKVTAYRRDQPDYGTLAQALVDLAKEQIKDERVA